MEDKCVLIYNEVVQLQKQLKDYHDDLNKRVTALEYFKNTAMGVCIAIGVVSKCVWDYIMERFV
jgi:hypothetical protein